MIETEIDIEIIEIVQNNYKIRILIVLSYLRIINRGIKTNICCLCFITCAEYGFVLVENQIEVNPTHVEELRDLIALNTQNASFATSLVDVKQNTFYIEGLKYELL